MVLQNDSVMKRTPYCRKFNKIETEVFIEEQQIEEAWKEARAYDRIMAIAYGIGPDRTMQTSSSDSTLVYSTDGGSLR